ncbi:hypothetical protein GE107_03310 [Cohnella sp. CFH 77786]|uniref:DUF294 nucleotidyltransferase-like domain-containing protein n=1 Tax=Cohnella sp. CFH 77786 TaxID=2662265 RepID=UPI001C60CB4A|nr:DUF294 nucleotidyltransferase-like domain-containing protein [Cohnella sp. CFH 77786]MBW5445092.1 hypothetical protein [Cohnella sp. CFH 77786]
MSSRNRENRHQAIREATDVHALRNIRESEQDRLSAALSSTPVNAALDSLSELHDALINRALELVETELARLGFGAPPVPYAYLLFGSGGRFEQTFSSDQDSGIVFANPETAQEAETYASYFRKFAETAVEFLIELGYPPCEGNVISTNPEWCLPLREWESKLDGWFAEPSWENVRYLLIIADGRAVAGDAGLADVLKNRFFTDMLQSPVIVRRMMENTLRHKVLVGIFGQLLRERYGENAGGLDIKYGAYIPMVNLFRLLAVQAGIRETSTLGRIAALAHEKKLTLVEAEQASSAFTLLLRMRLLTAVKTEGSQWIGSGKIPKKQLTKELTHLLKKALKFGKRMQRRVEREMQDRFGGR